MDIESLIYIGVLLWFAFGSLLGRKQKNKREPEPVELEWDGEDEGVWSEEPRTTYKSEEEGRASEMLPHDLWAEITGMPVEDDPVEEVSIPEWEPVQQERASLPEPSVHPIHRTHPEYGTDPSERTPSVQHGLGSLSDTQESSASVLRSQLGLIGDNQSLKTAVILHEVLGSPVALREQQGRDTITSRLWPSF